MSETLNFTQKKPIFEQLQTRGFCLINLQNHLLQEHLMELAKKKVYHQLCQANPRVKEQAFELKAYHQLVEKFAIEHGKLFPRHARYYRWHEIHELYSQFISNPLEALFQDIEWVEDHHTYQGEDALHEPLVYFRVVRPEAKSDAVHVHADVWSHQPIGMETSTIKIWIPLLGCGKGASFQLMPGSHLKDYQFDPVIKKTPESSFNIPKLLPGQKVQLHEIVCEPPNILLFHRKLLHGAMLNQTTSTRYSAEATAMIRNKDIDWL